MFGAIYIGLSGLGSYSDGLQAVSNNVSNLNTVGFKANDVTFQNVFGAGSQGGLEFGNAQVGSGYGVTITDGPLAGLLSRAVVVIDEAGKVVYTEQVPEITQEPNYEDALNAL